MLSLLELPQGVSKWSLASRVRSPLTDELSQVKFVFIYVYEINAAKQLTLFGHADSLQNPDSTLGSLCR